MTTTANALVEGALAYARAGLPVFPIWPLIEFRGSLICTCGKGLRCGRDAGKHPLGPLVRHGLTDASTDETVIRTWWTSRRDANIGIRTGSIVVVDVDPRHGGDKSLATLEYKHGALPPSWRVTTGGGGIHIYFAGSPETRGIKNSAGQLGPGLDVRATGGYVIGPPSRHVSGREYAWSIRDALAPLPAWLIALLQQPPAKVTGPVLRERYLQDVIDGKRNTTITSFAGYLLRHYVDPPVVRDLLLCWNRVHCKPPLSDAEVRGIVDSIAGRELRRRQAS
jgi:hypothetical protein